MHFSNFKLASSFVLGLGAVVSACGSGPEERSANDREQLAGRSLEWGGSKVSSFPNTQPSMATGVLCQNQSTFPPGAIDPCDQHALFDVFSMCSASLIGKNILLTASHCLCENPSNAPISFRRGAIKNIVTGVFHHPGKHCSKNGLPSDHEHDISILVLDKIFPNALPLKVYTDIDFYEKFLAKSLGNVVRAAGIGSKTPLGTPEEAPFVASIEPTFLSFFEVILLGKNTEASPFPGDSGGPLAVGDGGGSGVQFGITSGFIDPGDGIFAPTFDTKLFDVNQPASEMPNGEFIRQTLALVDGDGDGISDDIDNCPPSKCPLDSSLCSNKDQEDFDNDGVGDICDNCPPSFCKDIWNNSSLCKNSDQKDSDEDKIGDVCDICPETNSQSQTDNDGDKVGDVCDSCPSFSNPVASCSKDSDCSGVDGNKHACIFQNNVTLGRCSIQNKIEDMDGDGIGDACDICPEIKNQGNQADFDGDGVGDICDNCPKNPNEFIPCFGNNDCTSADGKPHKCIVKADGLGRCSVQLDDADNDGIGDSCDNCASVADATVQSNSNDLAESREALFTGQSATPRNDACDPVPVLRSTQVGSPKPDGASLLPLLPGTSGENDTIFVSSSGLGAGATGFGVPITSANRVVGFRHCSCRQGDIELPLDECWAKKCAQDPNQFTLKDDDFSLTWRKVTVGRYSVEKKEIKKPTLNPTFNLDFTSDVDCNSDVWPHSTYSDLCRFGEISIFRWNHLKDVSRPENSLPRPVQSFNNKQQTTGLFWSHVLKSSTLDAVSSRDAASSGRLRDSYEYTRTPSGIPVQIVIPTGTAIPCQFPGCRLIIRKDWLRDPGLLLPGDNLRYVGHSSLLVAQSGRILAAQQGGVDAIDVTDSFSDADFANYVSGTTSWLTSTEPGRPGRVAETAVQGIGLPRSFTPGVTNLMPVFVGNGSISLGSTRGAGGPARTLTASPTDAIEPGFDKNRTNAVGVFSGLEQNAYIVGGQIGEQQTGEIWEYGATTSEWRQLFSSSDVKPGRVLAVSYDSSTGNLLVLDELNAKWSSTARLLVFNTHTGEAKKIAAIPRHGVFEKFGLVVQGDDFWLVAGHKKGWKTFAFRLKGDKLTWTGLGSGKGQMLDIPFNSSEGVYLPVTHQGETYLEPIQPHTFETLWGCSEL